MTARTFCSVLVIGFCLVLASVVERTQAQIMNRITKHVLENMDANPNGDWNFAGIVHHALSGQIKTVCSGGYCDYTVICGADCTTEGSACAAGSAVVSITDSSITKPYMIYVYPGVYDECIHIDNKTDIALIGAGMHGTIIRPTVTAYDDIEGGVIRLAQTTTGVNTTARIEIANLTVHNDAFGAPEAGIQVGKEIGPGIDTAAPWNDVWIHDVLAIGHHDAIQFYGSRLTTDLEPPRIYLWNSISIGGRDNIVGKGFFVLHMWNIEGITKTNYCESTDTTHLAQLQDAVVSGSATTFEVQAADDPNVDRFFAGRKVDFDDNAGGPCGAADACDGHEGWITNYDESTRLVTFTPGCPGPTSIDTGCRYTIAAVPNANVPTVTANGIVPPCTDIDWTPIANAGGAANQGYWKTTVYHIGTGNNGPAPDTDIAYIRNSTFTIEVNDYGFAPDGAGTSPCGGSGNIAGFLYYSTGDHQDIYLDNLNIRININIDTADGVQCANPINCVAFTQNTGDLDLEGTLQFIGTCRIDNPADADENIHGILSDVAGTGSGAVTVPLAYIDINNTVGSYAGTSNHLHQGNNSTLTVVDVTSDAVITTAGTISGWSERCFTYENFIAGSDDIPIPISDGNVGLQLAYVGCRCLGTCGAAEDLTFEDDAGNQIGAGAVACVDNTADMTWTDVRSDADALIPASKSPRFDTTTASGTATDDLHVCVRYSTSRFAP